jgi:hypothetical protein
VRLSLTASYNKGTDNMNQDNFTWGHPKDDDFGYENPYDGLFPILNYNEPQHYFFGINIH